MIKTEALELQNILIPEMVDVVSKTIFGQEVDPKKTQGNKQLIQRRPEQKENQVDATFCMCQFHFQTSFFNDIHYGRR